jgi:hypothetical protein
VAAWSAEIPAEADSDQRFRLMPSEGKTPMPWEYAKYKNPHYNSAAQPRSTGGLPRGESLESFR